MAGGILLVARNPAAQFAVRVDLEVDGGSAVQLYVNDYSEPMRRPIVAGRQTYVFATHRNPITLVRLDPTDATGVRIRLHGIEIVAPDGRALARYAPSAIEQWISQGLTPVDASTGVLTSQSTNHYPFLIGQVPPVSAALAPGLRAALASRLRSEPWLPCVLLLPLLSLMEIRPMRPWLVRLAAVAGVLAIGPSIFRAAADIDWGPTPAVVAISRAAFVGASLPTTQMAIAAGFAAAGLVGLIVALWRRAAEPAARTPAHVSLWFVGVIWILAVLVTAPDLASTVAWFKSVRYSPHWDSDNLLTWTYWSGTGHLPFREFWFPYGGQFLFDRPWPDGPFLAWVAAAGRYAVFASALALGSERQRGAALLAAVALLAVDSSGMHLQAPRYLMGANIVLAYIAAMRSGFRDRIALSTLAIALVMALVFESVQLLYAGPAIAAIAGMDLLKQRRLGITWRGPAFCAAVVLLACVPLVAVLGTTGMLAEVLRFHVRLADTVQYAALPTPVDPDWWRRFAIGDAVLWVPVVCVLLGLVEYSRSDRQARLRASALIGLGVLNYVALQKFLVRPMPETLILYAVVAGLAFGVLRPEMRISRYRIGLGAAAGVLMALLLLTGRLDDGWQSATRMPAYAARSARILLSPEASAEANRERFAPERFDLYRSQQALVSTLMTRRGGPVKLFALSDDPILYVLTGQPPVWQVNQYNTAPWYEQEHLIASLREDPPDYLVAIPGRLTFDLVPLAVRDPDVVEFAVENYVADGSADPYVVLRRRRAGESVQPAFWRDVFGDTLDLGMLPLLLANADYKPCSPSARCEELLVLTAPDPVEKRTGSIGLDCAGSRVDVTLHLRSTQRRYVIPLSRLWPGVAARAAGGPIEVTSQGGFTIERIKAMRPAGRLY